MPFLVVGCGCRRLQSGAGGPPTVRLGGSGGTEGLHPAQASYRAPGLLTWAATIDRGRGRGRTRSIADGTATGTPPADASMRSVPDAAMPMSCGSPSGVHVYVWPPEDSGARRAHQTARCWPHRRTPGRLGGVPCRASRTGLRVRAPRCAGTLSADREGGMEGTGGMDLIRNGRLEWI